MEKVFEMMIYSSSIIAELFEGNAAIESSRAGEHGKCIQIRRKINIMNWIFNILTHEQQKKLLTQ